MALSKSTSYKGIDANYWKIHKLDSNTLYNQTVIRVALYKDKATRDASQDDYFRLDSFALNGVDFTRETAYKALKAMTAFDGAQDA